MGGHSEHHGGRDFDLEGSGAEPLALDDPRQIGPFTLIGLLGAGGMGRVYLGVASGRYAAVKRVLPLLAEDPDFLRHFRHELDNLARLPAGVSVPLLATDRTAKPPWFATEYIPGLTLSKALQLHGGPLPREALWRLLHDMATRLKALHALDMVHRDIKPSNIMLTLDGLALIDFGIARAVDQSRLTKTGMVLGTPEYMAPEQAEGAKSLTGAADVFALGSLLFFAATRESPFGSGSGLEVLYRIVHSTPDLSAIRGVDPGLADVIAGCLDKSPSARPTAADLLERAEGSAVPTAATWPAAITERLERRAAFAATVPTVSEPEPAVADVEPKPAAEAAETVKETEPAPAPAGVPAATEDRAESRRTPEARKRSRRLIMILPVVVGVGGFSVISLLPYVSAPGAGGKPSSAASVSVSPSARGSGPAPSAQPAHATAPKSAAASAASTAGSAGTGSGSRPGAGAGAGTGSGSGRSGGTGGSTGGSGGTAGGSSSGGSGGGTGTIGSAGTYRIRSAADGGCLEQDTSSGAPSTYAVSRSCASGPNPYSEWTFSPGPSGTFRVINRGTGDCLTAFMANGWINMDACGSTSGQYWEIGARTSSGSTLESTTYWQCMQMANDAEVVPCDTSQSAQLWSDGG